MNVRRHRQCAGEPLPDVEADPQRQRGKYDLAGNRQQFIDEIEGVHAECLLNAAASRVW